MSYELAFKEAGITIIETKDFAKYNTWFAQVSVNGQKRYVTGWFNPETGEGAFDNEIWWISKYNRTNSKKRLSDFGAYYSVMGKPFEKAVTWAETFQSRHSESKNELVAWLLEVH